MLFLKRNKHQSFTINIPNSDEKIVVKVLKIGKKSIILGIDSPAGFVVKRNDLILIDKKDK